MATSTKSSSSLSSSSICPMVVPFSANSTRKLTPPAATRLMRSQPSLPRGRYVRPTVNETLSAFCSHLTGSKQAQIDAAPTLPEVLAQFDEWRLALGLVHTDEEKNFAFAVRIPRGLAPALACVLSSRGVRSQQTCP